MKRSRLLLAATLGALTLLASAEAGRPSYPWTESAGGGTIAERIAPPSGFERIPAAPGGFGAWLRGLPLKPGRPPVRLFNGDLKGNQEAHHAVVEIDVGERDLQQCADAVIRLRAEYLYARSCDAGVQFRFTSGDLASWSAWREGRRPSVQGNRVSWSRSAAPDSGYRSFRRYLDTVFNYAGSASLSRELEKVADPSQVEIGDVFIRGGFPGHAVLVVDAAANRRGERVFLLAQSYMPAQEIQILRNPATRDSPWYRAAAAGDLVTPEWRFVQGDLRRFRAPLGCPP